MIQTKTPSLLFCVSDSLICCKRLQHWLPKSYSFSGLNHILYESHYIGQGHVATMGMRTEAGRILLLSHFFSDFWGLLLFLFYLFIYLFTCIYFLVSCCFAKFYLLVRVSRSNLFFLIPLPNDAMCVLASISTILIHFFV